MQTKSNDELQTKINAAQVAFVTSASRLLDEAEEVRRQRDELLGLINQADKSRARKEVAAV